MDACIVSVESTQTTQHYHCAIVIAFEYLDLPQIIITPQFDMLQG